VGRLPRPLLAACRRGPSGSRGSGAFGGDRADRGPPGGDGRPHGDRGPAAAWSRDRAIANSAAIITDIERFRQRTGAYPAALNSLWPDYHPGSIGIDRYRYEPSGAGYNLYFEHPSTNLAVREIVMYNPRGGQDFSSHAFDLLRLSPEEIRRQRGHFASYDLPQAGWKRFLFD
jgi:hypothetical protein